VSVSLASCFWQYYKCKEACHVCEMMSIMAMRKGEGCGLVSSSTKGGG
jgi:hypothetical protein